MIVSNSSPLIGLGRIGRLGLLKDLFGVVLIPEGVKSEVIDRGIENNAPDAYVIKIALSEGWIRIKETTVLSGLEDFGIDRGEAEAISLAKESDSKEVLIDERHARLAAKALGLTPRGTLYVLFLALKKNIITQNEYEKALFDLVKAGFRMSDQVYLEAIRMGRDLAGDNK